MGSKIQPTKDNDYVVAGLLNTVLLAIVQQVREVEALDLPEDYDWKLGELNRSYVLLVNELDKLYKQNSTLGEIEPKPFWSKYNILEPYYWQILRYLDEDAQEKGQAHINQLDRLRIIANSEKPELSPENKKLLGEALEAIKNYKEILKVAEVDKAEIDDEYFNDDAWYIPEYFVSYKNGEIVINKVLLLKKTHIGSTIDKLLEQALKSPNTLFIPELPATARNLSTVLSSAGFDSTLRQMFFPKLSLKKGVLFRPKVTDEQIQDESIDTTIIDLILEKIDPGIKNAR